MFIEALGSAPVANGVLCIETYARNAKGEDLPAGEILIPVTRVIAVADSLQNLIAQVRAEATKAAEDAVSDEQPKGEQPTYRRGQIGGFGLAGGRI